MAKNLQAGLRQSIKASRKAGVTGAGIFSLAPLDLRFALQKTLDPRVTFTRASTGTFVGSDGVLQSAVTNLLLRSEEFDNASWTKSNASVSANSAAAPNGTTTADSLIENSSVSVQHFAQQLVTVAANTLHTVSVFVKANTRSIVRFGLLNNILTSGAFAHFNAATGVISTQTTAGTATSVSYSIEPYANGWYRCRVSCVIDALSATASMFIGLVDDSNNATYTGNGTSGLFLWGAQLEQSSTAGEYIPTTSTINSAPRFDHNPTTGESLGLLVEEARTNSVTNNTMVGAVAGTPGTLPTGWGTFVSPTGLTRTIVGIGTVNGINYIDVRFSGTPSSTGEITLYLSPATTATLAQAWTSTAWLSLAGGSTSNIGVVNLRNFELNSGAYVREIGTSFVSSISSDFVRRQNITTSFGASANQIQLVLSIYATAAGTPIDITLRIGLPQLEQGAFATSVIPTTTATATRAADVASITGTAFSSFYNQTEGTVFADINTAPVANIAQGVFDLNEGVGSERIFQRRNSGGQIATAITDNGVVQGDFGSVSVPASGRARSGFAYRLNDFESAVNGSSNGTDTSGTVPTPDRINIGQNFGSGQVVNGTIRRLTYWPTRLANTTLQAITAP